MYLTIARIGELGNNREWQGTSDPIREIGEVGLLGDGNFLKEASLCKRWRPL